MLNDDTLVLLRRDYVATVFPRARFREERAPRRDALNLTRISCDAPM